MGLCDLYLAYLIESLSDVYKRQGVPAARWLISEDKAEIREFAKKVNYSLVAKPDRGVGASDTMRIHNAEELEQMLKTMHSGMIVEEFVHGTVCTFDGIINNQGKVVFATSHVYLGSVMEMCIRDSLHYDFELLNEKTPAN